MEKQLENGKKSITAGYYKLKANEHSLSNDDAVWIVKDNDGWLSMACLGDKDERKENYADIFQNDVEADALPNLNDYDLKDVEY